MKARHAELLRVCHVFCLCILGLLRNIFRCNEVIRLKDMKLSNLTFVLKESSIQIIGLVNNYNLPSSVEFNFSSLIVPSRVPQRNQLSQDYLQDYVLLLACFCPQDCTRTQIFSSVLGRLQEPSLMMMRCASVFHSGKQKPDTRGNFQN